ncbi:ribonuclease J [Caldicellulosiruptor bescii]|uniref:Ribonuclease J n=2 Tax=Caldicellulosiruptor bescii TaxID=31899 RepID=B9MPJ0_CALBD|nr:ribonuclease J [Caldicellulosiruptor bescii]ACM59751.1 beta-lactamase domain protein [Caldicellulosiruptor bescii DSM 6725]PBC87160.1 ribonuclease J [Caldicellulosiruptor bescii]PBC90099.1 ribonuclease J [Caldicellulosiruptor bescii]PBD04470.1 ribonuclease J [Caldicellulosiruptor bescii]PBD05896.1 ribonuclease J [Caldicellulosiruptor bescii]
MKKKQEHKIRIIPLGGLNEIGKNMTVIEVNDEIVVIDCGLAFPEDEMLGVDLVIPDISYLLKNKEKVKALILTHGHEDHIGAIPYVLRDLNVPIYGTRLTLGLVEIKLLEFGIDLNTVKLFTVRAGDVISFNNMRIEFIRTTHSIADSVAVAIHTPLGPIVHTGDFKVDFTPIEGESIDLIRFAELGKQGVLALLCDSTNAERPGFTLSEKTVGATFDRIFSQAQGRVIVATFSSHIHRVQQVINSAEKQGRKICVLGRSMVNVVNKALELGYLKMPDGMLIDVDELDNYPLNKIVLITTGSQGEPMSALSRMASAEHKKVGIIPGDVVIISAAPIPGNEKFVNRVINDLFKQGAQVIYEDIDDIHVSGHACQEEIKLIHNLTRPKYSIPVHGEFKHLIHHAKLAMELGEKNVFVLENGKVLEITKDGAKVVGMVQAGNVLVDGLGVGDVGNVVLRDRRHLAQDGLFIVVLTIDSATRDVISGPDIITRGFIYIRESEPLIEEAKRVIKDVLYFCNKNDITEPNAIKVILKDNLRNFLFEKTRRNPMIIPIITEI